MCERRERGSVLLLFPAGLLVTIVLASVAADAAVVFEAQCRLANAVAAAANDAAVEGLANGRFYRQGAVGLNDAEASRIAVEEVTAGLGGRMGNVSTRAVVNGPTVTVDASADVARIFAVAVPGGRRLAHVHARSTARAEER